MMELGEEKVSSFNQRTKNDVMNKLTFLIEAAGEREKLHG